MPRPLKLVSTSIIQYTKQLFPTHHERPLRSLIIYSSCLDVRVEKLSLWRPPRRRRRKKMKRPRPSRKSRRRRLLSGRHWQIRQLKRDPSAVEELRSPARSRSSRILLASIGHQLVPCWRDCMLSMMISWYGFYTFNFLFSVFMVVFSCPHSHRWFR